MKHKKSTILFATYISTVFIILFIGITPFLILVFSDSSIIFTGINIIASILLGIFIRNIVQKWMNYVIWEQCDLESLCLYLEKILNKKGHKNNINLQISLSSTYLLLGRQDACRDILDQLEQQQVRMSDLQAMNFQLLHIYYLSVENGFSTQKEEIKKAIETLSQSKKIKKSIKILMQQYLTLFSRLAEEQWESAIDLLNSHNRLTVFIEAANAYISGKCYYAMGAYQEAAQKFAFVKTWGGNTKYAALADNMLKSHPLQDIYTELPEKKPEQLKSAQYRLIGNILSACIIVITILFFNYYGSYGKSMEEICCKRYFCRENEVVMLYQEVFNDYEMAILSEDEKVIYCLFRKSSQEIGNRYQLLYSFAIDKYLNEHETEKTLERMAWYSSQQDIEHSRQFYYENGIKNTVWSVLTGFYRKNKVFSQEGFTYTGISYYADVEHITINGQPVRVEVIQLPNDNQQIYLWKADLMELKINISIDYKDN